MAIYKLPMNEPFTDEGRQTVEVAAVNAGIDLGSTGTRSCVFTKTGDEFSETVNIDSQCLEVVRDISMFTSPTHNIEDNLELIVTSGRESNILNGMHVVVGNLRKVLGDTTRTLAANCPKLSQRLTYENLLTNVAVMVLLESQRSGYNIVAPVQVRLSLSFPPEDLVSPKYVNQMKEKIADVYTANFLRLNTAVRFRIAASDIKITSEPEAVAMSYIATHDMPQDDVTVFIECGGRSTGIVVVKDSTLKSGERQTLNKGGRILVSKIAQSIAQKDELINTSTASIEKALDTGYIKNGAKRIDIVDYINKAKSEFSIDLYNGIMRALDINGLNATDVTRMVCSGRTFKQTLSEKGEVLSPSIMENLKSQFSAISPNTEWRRFSVEYPIPQGLMFAYISDF